MNDREELKALADQLTFAAENTLGCLYHQRKMLNDAATALRLAASPSSGAVGVKPLQWDKHPDDDEWYSYDHGNYGICDYIVYQSPVSTTAWCLKVRGHLLDDDFASSDEAKAAGQADYEQRIRSAIDALVPADGVRADSDLSYISQLIAENNELQSQLDAALAQTEGGKSSTSSDGSGSNAARTCDVPAASPSGDVTQAGHSPLIASDQERNRVRKDAGVAPGPSEANKATVCPYCNGTKRALYFGEQSWSHEERDCHVCRPSEATLATADERLCCFCDAVIGQRSTKCQVCGIEQPVARPAPADDAAVAWMIPEARLDQINMTILPPITASPAMADDWKRRGLNVVDLFTHPAKAVDVEAVKQCIQDHIDLNTFKKNDEGSVEIDAEGLVLTLSEYLTTGNASSETEGGR